ncbi:hypothetical protein AB7M16_000759 [Bradyrhizobium sp. USDA 372]
MLESAEYLLSNLATCVACGDGISCAGHPITKIAQEANKEHALGLSAARRRFARKVKLYQRICKLKPAEARELKATFALIGGNRVLDSGGLEDVERWCREAGALQEQERVLT